MAKDKKKSKKDKKKEEDGNKKDFIYQLRIAYRALEDPKKFYSTILFPLVFMGIIVFLMPIIYNWWDSSYLHWRFISIYFLEK